MLDATATEVGLERGPIAQKPLAQVTIRDQLRTARVAACKDPGSARAEGDGGDGDEPGDDLPTMMDVEGEGEGGVRRVWAAQDAGPRLYARYKVAPRQ